MQCTGHEPAPTAPADAVQYSPEATASTFTVRGVLRHRAHDRLIAGAGKAGVVDEVPRSRVRRPRTAKSCPLRRRSQSGYCGRGRACNRSPRPTPPVYPVGCRAHTLRRQQLSRAARHAAAPLDLQVKRVRHRRTLRRWLHPAQIGAGETLRVAVVAGGSP